MDRFSGDGHNYGAEKAREVNAGVIVEVFILDSNRRFTDILRHLITFNNKTIVFCSGIFPKNNDVAVEIAIDGFGNNDVGEFNVSNIFFEVEEKRTDENNSEEHTSETEFQEGFQASE